MPELPEVEHLRQTLERRLVGARIAAIRCGVHDVTDRSAYGRNAAAERMLLVGATITELRRRGKNLALVASDGRVLGVHLGMSGRVTFEPPEEGDRHAHVAWKVEPRGGAKGWMTFRDPRRFGGLVALPTLDALATHWADLGPDGFLASPAELLERLVGRRRQAKAALLDQSVVAGVGNIYADEALFRARLHPLQPLDRLPEPRVAELVGIVQSVLREAVEAGGSTLRDYVDADNQPGAFQRLHVVYGRAGLACPTCGQPLRGTTAAGRTTVFCSRCQPVVHMRRRKRS